MSSHEDHAPDTYEDGIRVIGVPNKTEIDNAKVLIGIRLISINRKYCIEIDLMVPCH